MTIHSTKLRQQEQEELATVVVFSANILDAGSRPKKQQDEVFTTAEEFYRKLERLNLLRRISTEQAMAEAAATAKSTMPTYNDVPRQQISCNEVSPRKQVSFAPTTMSHRRSASAGTSARARSNKSKSSSSSSKSPKNKKYPSSSPPSKSTATSPFSVSTVFTSPSISTSPSTSPLSIDSLSPTTIAQLVDGIPPPAPSLSPIAFSTRRKYPILPDNPQHRRSMSLDLHQIGLYNRSSSRSLVLEESKDDTFVPEPHQEQPSSPQQQKEQPCRVPIWCALRRKLQAQRRKHQLP